MHRTVKRRRWAALRLQHLETRCVPHGVYAPDNYTGGLFGDLNDKGDDEVHVSFEGPFTPPSTWGPVNSGPGGGGPDGPLSPIPVTFTTAPNGMPLLNSAPGAAATIYLDFDGETVGTTTYTPYDTDGSASTFGSAEQQVIYEAWRQTSVYYSMFDVNVTTVKTAAGTPMAWALESNSISGGYSYVGVFPNNMPESFNQSSNSSSRVSGIAHELGHNFGLG